MAEIGSWVEAGANIVKLLAGAEFGAGVEAGANVVKLLAGAEFSAGVEAGTNIVKLLAGAEFGTGVEAGIMVVVALGECTRALVARLAEELGWAEDGGSLITGLARGGWRREATAEVFALAIVCELREW